MPDERWCELFDAASARPVLWQAWAEIVRAMAAAPGTAVAAIVAGLELGRAPDDWRRRVAGGRRRRARQALRAGRGSAVPVLDGACDARASRQGSGARRRRRRHDGDRIAMSTPADALKGYKGHARAALERWGVRVWSDVQVENDAGSHFEGVILPRSETQDDLHVVIKLKNGYNVGLHVDRVRSVKEVGYKEAIYKIPEKEFPRRPNLPSVTLLGTGGTIASRLDYRTGAVIPAFTPGELYGAVPELADICNLTTKKLFGVFSENMAKEQYIALAEAIGEEIRERRRRHRHRPRHRHDGPHGRDPVVHGAGHAGADRAGRVAAVERPAVERRRAEPDPLGPVGRVRRHRRGADLHVRPDLGPLRPAAPRHALPEDAQLLPEHVPHRRRHPARDGQPRQLHLPPRRLPQARQDAADQDRRGVRRPDDHPLLLPGDVAGPRGRARREGLPRASSSPAPASATSTSRSTRR